MIKAVKMEVLVAGVGVGTFMPQGFVASLTTVIR